MRIALRVEYDGSQFHGFQSQPALRTVQQTLELALSRVADHEVGVVCAGRTDTGVHATNQMIHMDCTAERTIRSWIHGANTFLPKDVRVTWGRDMPDEFHARYSALSRRYRYVIYNASIRPALFRGQVTWQYRPLDHRLMQQAATYLLGEHDFTSFRALECQSKTPMRNVHRLDVTRMGDFIIIDITANAFLHHMVRNMVGVLGLVGQGRKPPAWVEEILLARDRKLGAETAPPYGLYLVGVEYPALFSVTKVAPGPLFLLGES